MSTPAAHYDVAVPPGTQRVAGVYVNGVPLVEGSDYEVRPDRVRILRPIAEREEVSGIGKLLLSVGIGVYPKGDVIDLEIERAGRSDVVRGRPLGR